MTNLNPKVSIVLPVYNGARYLAQAIDSCLNQTHQNIELIIVDDCSTDETPEIIQSFNDARIRYVRNKTNQRLPRSLNIGFALATGEYLTWTSDDNMYKENAIETMVQCLQENNGYDFVYADYWAYYVATETKVLRQLPEISRLHKQNCAGACFLYTRKVRETIGGYSPQLELVEDYDYWIRISRKFKMFHCRQPLCIHSVQNHSLESARQRSIILLENVLKYQNGFISLLDLARATIIFCVDVLKFRYPLNKTISIYCQAISRMKRISPYLVTKILIPFIYLMARKIIKSFLTLAIDYMAHLYTWLDINKKCSGLPCSKKGENGRTHVLCVVPFLVAGGAEKVLLDVVSGLKDEKYDFYVVTTQIREHVWIDKFRLYFKSIFIPSEKIFGSRVYRQYIRNLIKRFGIKVVILSNAPLGYEALPKLKNEFKDLRVIDILHVEGWVATTDELMWVAPFIDKRICISHRLRKFMADKYTAFGFDGKYDGRLAVIHNGIELNGSLKGANPCSSFRKKYNIPPETKIISFVGRLSPEKNVSTFVNIAIKLVNCETKQTLKFVIAGDGFEMDQIRERIKSSGIEEFILLAGMVDNVAELMKDTHLLLVVSKKEGIPLVIPEALAWGVPVISTDVGAIREIIQDGVNGYLVDPNTDVTDQFVAKIGYLLTHENHYKLLSSKARESIIPEFSIETMHSRYKDVFEKLNPYDIKQ